MWLILIAEPVQVRESSYNIQTSHWSTRHWSNSGKL